MQDFLNVFNVLIIVQAAIILVDQLFVMNVKELIDTF